MRMVDPNINGDAPLEDGWDDPFPEVIVDDDG